MTATRGPTFGQACLSAVLLSLLFLAVYGLTNAIASQRADVGMWFQDWELQIPLVPIMIVPYMSIDLFFVAAPFLCTTRAELRTHSRRVILAIVLAGVCFVLMPLTTGFERTLPPGWTAPLFQLLHGFDQPHNLFPSLHITLLTILTALHARHTGGLLRIASIVWFGLVGLSTLLTHQHHVVDVLGGLALAGICFYVFPTNRESGSTARNASVGVRYGIAGFACAVMAALPVPWLWILAWPAVSFMLTASAYLWFGPGIYRKQNGRVPLVTNLLLAPTLVGQWLSWLMYKRSSACWNEVLPTVWMGFRLGEREAALAVEQGVTAVVDLTAEFSEAAPLRRLHYLSLQALDLTALTPEQLNRAADFIHEHSQRGIVYVHCKVGYSRSASVIGAFLMKYGHCTSVAETLAFVRRQRPGIIFRPEAVESLNQFAALQWKVGVVAIT